MTNVLKNKTFKNLWYESLVFLFAVKRSDSTRSVTAQKYRMITIQRP
jgi:hypothetical protein